MRVFSLTVLLIIACSPLFAAQTPRPFLFGLNLTATDDKSCEMAKAAGCTAIRIGLGWDLVEKKPGEYDFSEPDRAVAQCIKYGFEPFFLIVATPPFYLKEEMRNKVWGWPALPEYYPQAEKFYKMISERYKGKVKYYEFWNEQNGWGWHDTGKPEEYAPILKVAYKALKEGDPNCLVSIGGLDGAGWKGYYHYVEKLYELGCKDSFDAVTVHPYRADGPIDVYGLKRIHQLLVDHGNGDRKVWITEYGWSKAYGHELKAKWLKESLDLLTSPELDFVIQASVHTLTDFDGEEFGLCDRSLKPRYGYYTFKNYPKDWKEIEKLQSAAKLENKAKVQLEDFESGWNNWTSYGDGLTMRYANSVDVTPENGKRILVAATKDKLLSGGAYRIIETAPNVPILVDARAYTQQHGSKANNSQVRVGIDPTAGTDPKNDSVIWGRWMDTSGEWDTAGVGRIKTIIPKGNKVTVFLEYKHSNENVGQVSAFDNIQIIAHEDTFVLPEVPAADK